jgi:hypothetical protein
MPYTIYDIFFSYRIFEKLLYFLAPRPRYNRDNYRGIRTSMINYCGILTTINNYRELHVKFNKETKVSQF